jgi:predicted transcriptional regulator
MPAEPSAEGKGAGGPKDSASSGSGEATGEESSGAKDNGGDAKDSGSGAKDNGGDAKDSGGVGEDGGPQDDHGRLNLTDPKAIRALAHPLRWSLLDALEQAGTLTATQAGEMLGESPANCAFHLRTLAKYGFVEEAGGGRGRVRPWRLRYDSMRLRSFQDDPEATQAAHALTQVWLDRLLARAQGSLTSRTSWPKALENELGSSASRLYLTPAEAIEIYSEINKVYDRVVGTQSHYKERRDPELRPPDAIPVELILLGYPILDLPSLPGDEGAQPES